MIWWWALDGPVWHWTGVCVMCCIGHHVCCTSLSVSEEVCYISLPSTNVALQVCLIISRFTFVQCTHYHWLSLIFCTRLILWEWSASKMYHALVKLVHSNIIDTKQDRFPSIFSPFWHYYISVSKSWFWLKALTNHGSFCKATGPKICSTYRKRGLWQPVMIKLSWLQPWWRTWRNICWNVYCCQGNNTFVKQNLWASLLV